MQNSDDRHGPDHTPDHDSDPARTPGDGWVGGVQAAATPTEVSRATRATRTRRAPRCDRPRVTKSLAVLSMPPTSPSRSEEMVPGVAPRRPPTRWWLGRLPADAVASRSFHPHLSSRSFHPHLSSSP